MIRILLILVSLVVLAILGFLAYTGLKPEKTLPTNIEPEKVLPIPSTLPSSSPQVLAPTLKFSELSIPKHNYQTFNNCGPATLAMILSFWGFDVSQRELGAKLRPYQNPQGDNDDKSVTLEEFGLEAKNFKLVSFIRANGDIEKLKRFLSNGLPVITRTWLHPNEDIGHFRIIKGFDEERREIIQDDSYQGPNLRFSYDQFLSLWQPFNYEYLVLVPEDRKSLVEQILGEEVLEKKAFENALERARLEALKDSGSPYPLFNQAVNYYYLGRFDQAISRFEAVSSRLPFRMLWYQIQPVKAYLESGDYPKVFELTDQILGKFNKAFSELYILRGQAYLKMGKIDLAKVEFEKALFFNQNLQLAKDALSAI